jgi:hypothetical protein
MKNKKYNNEEVAREADVLFWHLVGILKEESNNLSDDNTFSEGVYNRVFSLFREGGVEYYESIL